MAYDPKLKEEEVKNRVAADVFGDYDCARVIGAVDFCVSPKTSGPQLIEPESLLWAEAKSGVRADFAPLFAQLVLTLGKARTFDDHLPPPFLAAFDSEKIAFLPYHEVVDLFYLNDFNWNVAPSDETTREFHAILDRVRPLLDSRLFTFRFDEDAIELDTFIRPIVMTRLNFKEYAVFNGRRCSNDFNWYSRTTVIKTSGAGVATYNFHARAGLMDENEAGGGTTSIAP